MEGKYKDAIIRDGEIDKLVEVDTGAALEILAQKGQWDQVFEAASMQSPELLHKYVAQRAAHLLKSHSPIQALRLYMQYGALPIPQYFNLYLKLSETILNSDETYNEYKYLSQLRSVLYELCKSLDLSTASGLKFRKYLEATHYSAVRYGCHEFSGLTGIITKTSITLIRYSDILLPDRCYYNAGIDARSSGLTSEAFIFLNHFLDLEECIEEGDSNILDVDDLRVTDFPLEVPLPATLSMTKEQREEAKEWVLAISMDQKVEQGLPIDQRGVYIGSLTSSISNSIPLQECTLTGYPIRGPVIKFEKSNRVTDRDDWTKLVNVARQTSSDSPLNDIILFIQDWCGAVPTYSF